MHRTSDLDPKQLLADHRWLSRLAVALVGDPGRADDACQDAWLAAHRRQPGEAPTRAWLAGALRRIVRGQRRQDARRARRERQAASTEDLPSTEELIERSEARQRVAREMLAIEEPFRTALLLRFQEGLEPVEIARLQGCKADSVRWRIRRGLALLRSRLERVLGPDWRASILIAVPASIPIDPWGPALPPITSPAALGGILMVTMKWKLAAATIVVAIATVGTFAFVSNRDAPPMVPDRPAPAATAAGAAPEREPNANPAAPEFATAERVAVTATDPSSREETACRVEGRVVDSVDRPIADVVVRISSHRNWEHRALTAADGSFVLETPIQTTEEVWLHVEPGPHHDRARQVLGTSRRCDGGPLEAGPRDVGTFRLVDAGVVRGRVEDARGQPVVEALVMVRSGSGGPSPGTGTAARSDAHGRFTVPHVRPGKFELQVQSYGHLIATRSVEVKGGRTTDDIVVRIVEAPTISGRIVDELGQPVAGVGVRARGFLYGWGTESDVAGRFVVSVANDQPAELGIRSEEYEPVIRDGARFAPGTENLELVVRRLGEPTVFRVVDAETGAKITRFGIEIDRHGGPSGDRALHVTTGGEPSPGAHADGTASLVARPGIDAFHVVAPGYRPRRGAVQHDSPDSRTQTLSLVRGGGVHGRVVRDGRPVAGAAVVFAVGDYAQIEMTEDSLPTSGELFDGYRPDMILRYRGIALSPGAPRWRYERFGRGERKTRTDEDGRFAVAGLPEPHYLLQVDDHEGPPLIVAPLRLEPDRVNDIGDLELPASTTLQGRIELACAGPLAGHRVRLGDQRGETAVTDARGAFRFESVAPGGRFLRFEPGPDIIAERPLYFVRSDDDGKFGEIVLPIDNRPTCRLVAKIHSNVSLRGATLVLTPADGGKPLSVRGDFDAEGRLVATVAAIGEVTPTLRLGPRRLPLGSYRLELSAGAEVSLASELQLGSVAITRRAGWPENGKLVLRLRPLDRVSEVIEATVEFSSGGLDGYGAGDASLVGSECTLHQLPIGEFQIEVTVYVAGVVTWQHVSVGSIAPGETTRLDG